MFPICFVPQLFGDAASLTEQEEEAIEDSPPPLLVQNDIGVAVTVSFDDSFEVCDVTSVVGVDHLILFVAFIFEEFTKMPTH